MRRLTDDQIASAVVQTAWEREGGAIVRDVRFPDFAAAVAFVNRVADLAERANHHPDILLHRWNRVRLTLSTHSEGGITEADVDLARAIDATVASVA